MDRCDLLHIDFVQRFQTNVYRYWWWTPNIGSCFYIWVSKTSIVNNTFTNMLSVKKSICWFQGYFFACELRGITSLSSRFTSLSDFTHEQNSNMSSPTVTPYPSTPNSTPDVLYAIIITPTAWVISGIDTYSTSVVLSFITSQTFYDWNNYRCIKLLWLCSHYYYRSCQPSFSAPVFYFVY